MAFESDTLPLVRGLNGAIPNLRVVIGLHRASLCIVDTCYLLRATRARVQLRTVGGRTAFEEAVDSGMLIAAAPPEVLVEFDANVESFAAKTRCDVTRLRAALVDVCRRIAILPAPELESPDIAAVRKADPKDVPFARLYEHLQADWMLSDDGHWDVSSYRVKKDRDGLGLVVLHKDYARTAAVI